MFFSALRLDSYGAGKQPAVFDEPSTIMLEQIRTIDKNRVSGSLGKISLKEMMNVDKVLISLYICSGQHLYFISILKRLHVDSNCQHVLRYIQVSAS